jgi:sulfate transport system permease protein
MTRATSDAHGETHGGGSAARGHRPALPQADGLLAWGTTWTVLGLLVLLPLSAVVWKASGAGVGGILASVSTPIARAALALSFFGALVTAGLNTVMGTVLAWALTRYEFVGKSIANAVVDLPFALPTAVAGITLSELLGPRGWIGALNPALAVAFTPAGVLVAMTFVSIPFAVRSVQPVLAEVQADVEEAASLLGASPWQVFVHVLLPTLRPAMLTGLALSFARAVGEFGSVVIISGNIPLRTLTGPVLIFQRLEEYDTVGATSVAVVMLMTALLTLLAVNVVQARGRHV